MEQKRVELHLHTNMSQMDGVTSAEALIHQAAAWGHKAVAITDHGVVQAFPEAAETARQLAKEGVEIKILYGVEAFCIDDEADEDWKDQRPCHRILLAQNQTGLKNLYKLISISHLDYCFRGLPHIPKSKLTEYREGLLIGSACEEGELLQAVKEGKPWDELCEIARFYDFLEIQPSENHAAMRKDGLSLEALEEMNRVIVRLGEELQIPVCATGDVHFCKPQDEVYRRILLPGLFDGETDAQPPLYFRDTADMLAAFACLGEEKAYEVVVENPNRVADQIQSLRPIPEGIYPPHMEGAEEKLQAIVWSKANDLYSDPLPDIVRERLEKELFYICNNGFAFHYMIAQKLVADSEAHGYPVGTRGSVGSSLVAYMAGITEMNPLPPHYLCPKCHHTEFFTHGEVGSGFDLPGKNCPVCGEPLERDGHEIPYETFMGFYMDKEPDIDLNIASEYQASAMEYTRTLFGKEKVFHAGVISTVATSTAHRYVEAYAEKWGLRLSDAEADRLAEGCTGVKRNTGAHPGGLMIIPADREPEDFTPLQYEANQPEKGRIVSHFAFHSLHDAILKLDILGHIVPTIYKYLEEYTGVRVKDVPLCDPKVYSLFTSPEALGVTPGEIGCETGTLSLPEMGVPFVRRMLTETQPKNFSDLVQISGLSHGTDVWHNNAEELIRDGVCTLSEAIAVRDRIMTDLMHKGMDSKTAFKITEIVRKGQAARRLTPELQKAMEDCGVPSWYIDSCMKIRYMFPKAHAVAYVLMAIRLGWYKLYHPTAYYAAYFTVRCDPGELDVDALLKGKDAVKALLDEMPPLEQQTYSQQYAAIQMQIALEALARGITFLPADTEKSDPRRFLPEGGTIRLPLSYR